MTKKSLRFYIFYCLKPCEKFEMEACLLMGRRGEWRGEYEQTNPLNKFNSFVNSPLTNINLVGRPTKTKWKIHVVLYRQRVVDLSFIVTRASKKKALFWLRRINCDYYEKFCRKMFFFLSFLFQVYEKRKMHTKLNQASKFTLNPI